MLAQHCVDCGMPLFEYEGKIICPSCKREFRIDESGKAVPVVEEKREVVKKKEDFEKKEREEREDVEIEKKGEGKEVKKVSSDVEYAKEKLKRKLVDVVSLMDECDSLEALNDLVDLADKIIDLIERIDRIVRK